jgi:Tfp pilus assembly protein PilO
MRNKGTWITVCLLATVLAGGLGWLWNTNRKASELSGYVARAELLESEDRNHGLGIAEKAELEELRVRIGKMKADGVMK